MKAEALAAAGKAGFCRVGLVVEQGWVPWNGTLAGALVFQGSERPQAFITCRVSLTAPGPGGDTDTAWDTQSWERLTIQAHERRELPFTLRLGWATGGFGPIAAARAALTPAGGWLSWPCTLSVGVEVTPPPEFVRTGVTLAELTGFNLGVWHTVMAGDGARVTLRPRDAESRITGMELQLFRSTERDYGDVVLHSRGVRPRRIPLRLPREDEEAARRLIIQQLAPILSDTNALPIPSGAGARADNLPVPAEPAQPDAGRLPRPAPAPDEM